jgi:hypothetical protein
MLLRRLGLVMWKNLLLRKKHWIVTLFEIVIPLVLFIVAVAVRLVAGTSVVIFNPAQYFPVENEERLLYTSSVLYAPNNNFTRWMMDSVISSGSVLNRKFLSSGKMR